MADYFGAAEDLFQGVGDVFSGFAEAAGSKQAAKFYGEAANYAGEAGEIKNIMLRRQAFQTIGGAQADVASSGLKLSGSAQDVMRSSAQQASLSQAINNINTRIQVGSYQAQAASAEAAAKAQKGGGILGGIGSLVGAAASIFSDDTLKTNIILVRRRADGLGVYRYCYEGIEGTFQGVLASEVEKTYPSAISMRDGWRQVDYEAIGAEFRRIA